MLRESSNAKGEGYDLNLLTGAGGDGNIPHGALLVSFADAVLGTDNRRLDDVRAALGINAFAEQRGEIADPRERPGVERI